MTPQEILMLIKAGYTKADIDSMAASVSEAKKEDPKPEQAAQEDQQTEPVAQEEQSVEERFAAINQTLDKMVRTMERMAIRDSKQPEVKDRTPEEVLAAVAEMYK